MTTHVELLYNRQGQTVDIKESHNKDMVRESHLGRNDVFRDR